MNKFDAVANLAIFLTEKTGSCLGRWKGRMSAKDQRELFGAFFGKGLLVIDGEKETVEHIVGRCFGMDYEVTAERSWVAASEYVRGCGISTQVPLELEDVPF